MTPRGALTPVAPPPSSEEATHPPHTPSARVSGRNGGERAAVRGAKPCLNSGEWANYIAGIKHQIPAIMRLHHNGLRGIIATRGQLFVLVLLPLLLTLGVQTDKKSKNKEEEEERQVFLNVRREKERAGESDEENNGEEWVK